MSTTELKVGQIVESYQGKFAKVIGIKENGIKHLSAWVKTKAAAEDEERVMVRLNDFGLSQVLKGGQNAPGAEKTAPEKTAEKPKKEAAKKTAEKQD